MKQPKKVSEKTLKLGEKRKPTTPKFHVIGD